MYISGSYRLALFDNDDDDVAVITSTSVFHVGRTVFRLHNPHNPRGERWRWRGSADTTEYRYVVFSCFNQRCIYHQPSSETFKIHQCK